jgi:predicted nucleic acid-binding protein
LSLVLDSSIALAWFFADEFSPGAASVLERVVEAGAHVPTIWRLEVANGLQMAVRRGRVDTTFRDASLTDLAALAIITDEETHRYAWSTTLQLAERFRLTIYDAAFLELAQRLKLPLASLDEDLRAAGEALGVEVLGG